MSKVLINKGFNVKSSDLIDRGFGEVQDFLKFEGEFNGDILTNPPFKLAEEFVEKAMQSVHIGNRVIFFLKIQFLESETRYKLFKKYNPKYIYVHSSRQICAKGGEFEKYHAGTQFYAWYIFEKGYKGETILRWIKKND